MCLFIERHNLSTHVLANIDTTALSIAFENQGQKLPLVSPSPLRSWGTKILTGINSGIVMGHEILVEDAAVATQMDRKTSQMGVAKCCPFVFFLSFLVFNRTMHRTALFTFCFAPSLIPSRHCTKKIIKCIACM